MGRRFKNSDDSTYYSDKAIDQKLEKLRYELIPGYTGRKKNNNNKNKNFQKTPRKKLFQN
jgi:hypothetical protein